MPATTLAVATISAATRSARPWPAPRVGDKIHAGHHLGGGHQLGGDQIHASPASFTRWQPDPCSMASVLRHCTAMAMPLAAATKDCNTAARVIVVDRVLRLHGAPTSATTAVTSMAYFVVALAAAQN